MSAVSAANLRERIQVIYDLGERFDDRDYFGRLWVATYCGYVDTIADYLLDLLDGGAELPRDDAA